MQIVLLIDGIEKCIIYRRSLKRNTPKEKEQATGVLHGMFHIAVPCTLSSAARSLLSTAENLLIPRELGRYGLSRAASMSAYGLLQGMAMPMLYFPSSFLTSFASLLIPKTAREFELSHRRAVRHITQRAVHAALQFGIFCAVILIFFCVGHICIGMSLQSTCIWTISQWHMDIPEGCVSKTDWYGRWANRDSSKKADRLLKFYGRSANDKNWNVLPGIMALISIIRMVRRDITWIRRYTSLRRKFRGSI